MLQDRHPGESVPATIGHLDGIEALRAIAVTMVVLFHYRVAREGALPDPWIAAAGTMAPLDAALHHGYLGVDLFFLITGFLLVMPWARNAFEGREAPAARDFYVRRIRRIVPAYFVHLVLLFAVFVPLVLGPDWVKRHWLLFTANVLAHATFLQYTTPITSSSLSVNGALWSLTLEAQFYLLLPLLAPVFVRRPWLVGFVLFVVAALWRWAARDAMDPLVAMHMAIGARGGVSEEAVRHLLKTQLPGYLGHFAAGMAMGWLTVRHRPRADEPTSWKWIAASVAGIALLLWTFPANGGARLGLAGLLVATVGGLALLFTGVVRGGRAVRLVLARAPVVFVGRTSYSIYLYHLPLLMTWNRFGILDGSAWSLPAYLATTLAAAWLSWRFVERPFLRR